MARSFAKVIVHSVYSLGPPLRGYGYLWQRYPGLRKRSQSSHSPGHPACWVAWAGIGLCLRHGRSLCVFTNETLAQPAECSTLHHNRGNVAFPGGHAPTRERLPPDAASSWPIASRLLRTIATARPAFV